VLGFHFVSTQPTALLFFKLRAIPFEGLLKKSVDEKMKNLLKNANRKTERVLKGDIAKIFGL
jgi:hypothetical protein